MAWLTGYPREQIKWHPTVDYSKCVMCGMCMNCGKKVYTWTKIRSHCYKSRQLCNWLYFLSNTL